MSIHTLVLSPDKLVENYNDTDVRVPIDEIRFLDMLKGVQCLIIEQGPEAGHSVILPGRLNIPGEIMIRPGAVLEVAGSMKAGRIIGEEGAKLYVSGDLSVKSIHVNPGMGEGSSPRASDILGQPGIVVSGLLKSEGAIRSRCGSITARSLSAKAEIEAGGAIKVVEDIHALSIKSGAEVIAGGLIYAPEGSVNAGGRISAQLLHAKSFYPGIPTDLASVKSEKDRSVIGNVTGGDVMNGLRIPRPKPFLVPKYRIPGSVQFCLSQRQGGEKVAVDADNGLEVSV